MAASTLTVVENKSSFYSQEEDGMILNLREENDKHLRNIKYISNNWKLLKDKIAELSSLYVKEMRKNEELESELVELGAKCERTAIFLSMTERARNNLEESNSKLEAELDALKAQVQQQNLREGHIDSNHTETEGQSTTGEELTTISFIPRVRRLSENSNAIVQQARVLALTKSYEDLRAESEQRHSDIKQLKGVVLKLKTKAKEQELHRNVLEKRINIMSESMTSKCVEINEAREAHESLSLQLATVSELNGALLFQLKLASDGKVSCAESLESQRMREEELLMRLLVVQEINIDQNKILIALNNEIQCIKREDPVLLQQLRFDIFTLHAQKNHCEAKASSIGKELRLRISEGRRYMYSMSQLQSRLEEVTNERRALKEALDGALSSLLPSSNSMFRNLM